MRKILPLQRETKCEVNVADLKGGWIFLVVFCRFFLHGRHRTLHLARAGEVLSHRAATSPERTVLGRGLSLCRLPSHTVAVALTVV